tara:strand:+ start:546 stop:1343 length:798 start_codon:yes stop_codon:yes gene_type:complete
MRHCKKVLLFIVTGVILLLFTVYFMQEKLIFLPTKLSQDYEYSFSTPFEEFNIETNDGAKLNALHFKVDTPKGVILYFHGNAGDLSRWGEIVIPFTEQGYDVIVMDYRTYGKSTGKLSEKALYGDAQLFYDYAIQIYGEDEVITYGRSLGTTFATYIASKNDVKKLILETPFYNLNDAAKHRFPAVAVKYLLRFKFPSNKFIEQVKAPVIIFHGTGDNVVPYSSGKKLAGLVKKEQLTFVTIPGGGHNDLINFEGYRVALEEVLN